MRSIKIITGAALVLAVLCVSQAAVAQESVERPVHAPRNAFELTLGGGYGRSLGRLTNDAPDIAGISEGGAGVALGLGYRAIPHLSLGVVGQYMQLANDTGGDRAPIRSGSAGIDFTIHFSPYERLDPNLSVGGGWRMIAIDNPGAVPNVTLHGIQIARAQLGLDVPATRDVALGPFVGADATWYLTRVTQGAGTEDVADRGISTMFFAGLQGRFDFGGTRDKGYPSAPAYTAKR
jgi:hypothetical protein